MYFLHMYSKKIFYRHFVILLTKACISTIQQNFNIVLSSSQNINGNKKNVKQITTSVLFSLNRLMTNEQRYTTVVI